MEIGQRIRAIRQGKGITQDKLALLTGFNRVYINQLENGRYKNITITNLRKIATALEISLDEFGDIEKDVAGELTGNKMSIGEKLKEARLKKSLTQEALGKLSGLGRTYVNHIECGRIPNITMQTAQKLAGALGISTDDLMEVKTSDKTGLSDRPIDDMLSIFSTKLRQLEVVEIPVRGVIPAGNPAVEEEIDLGVIRVPREVVEGKIDRVFALKIGGESLSGDGLHYGDNVLIDPDAPIIDGKIYAVRIGGTEVLARHVYKEDGHLRLESSNGEYKRLLATDVEIQGRLIYQMRKL